MDQHFSHVYFRGCVRLQACDRPRLLVPSSYRGGRWEREAAREASPACWFPCQGWGAPRAMERPAHAGLACRRGARSLWGLVLRVPRPDPIGSLCHQPAQFPARHPRQTASLGHPNPLQHSTEHAGLGEGWMEPSWGCFALPHAHSPHLMDVASFRSCTRSPTS